MKQQSFQNSLILIIGMLSLLVMSWEQSQADAVLAQGRADAAVIPEEAIRLRILADSDAPEEQVLKRRVRDAVIEAMNEWAPETQSIEEARRTVEAKLPEIAALAEQVVASSGFDHEVNVELGVVPFPTKVYGGRVYPAGDYEAVRITIGRGLGQNWWCVLFPPLCFVDVAAAETPAAGTAAAALLLEETEEGASGAEEAVKDERQVEFRFFLLELIAEVIETIRAWFGK